MLTFTLIAMHLWSPPVSNDREVAPVEIDAPAETSQPQPPPPAQPPSQSQSQPQAQPADDGALYLVAPIVAKPAPPPASVPPPPPPPPKRPDRPIGWRVDVLGTIGTAVFRDPAWRAFDHNRSAAQWSVTVRGDTRLGAGRLFLGGGATLRGFSSGGLPYGSYSASVRAREPIAFVRLAAMMVEGVDLFAQAGGGVSILDLSLYSFTNASQRSFVPLAEGLAGVALYLPKRWLPRRGASRATAGLELGAGYTWRGNVDAKPRLETQPEPIETSSANLGDVALRGFTWRLGIFVRFQ